MNRSFEQFEVLAEKEFGSNDNKRKMARRAIELAKEWDEAHYGSSEESVEDKKARCSKYITEKITSEKQNYGLIGSLIGAVLFSLLVQLIVKWIMDKFFDDK